MGDNMSELTFKTAEREDSKLILEYIKKEILIIF